MTVNAALMIALLGSALWLVAPEPTADVRSRARCWLGQAVAILCAALGIATLVEYLLGWNPGIDVQVFGDPQALELHAIPGRPSFPTALSGVALGLGLGLLNARIRRVWLSEVFAVMSMQIALLAVIGHVFRVPELYWSLSSMPGTGMAIHSAAAFLALAAGLLCARPKRGLMAVLRSQTPGGMLARRWMLAPAVALVAMGFVYLAHKTAGLDHAIGTWMLVITGFFVLTAAVWGTAEVLHQAGLERDLAHQELEDRVRERTSDLNQANAALSAAKEELARANQHLEKTVTERTNHLNETIRSLETVCYNIAHDLRGPNRAIAGFAQVLLSEHSAPLTETAHEFLRRIAAAAQRSDALTLDLLAYGRLGHTELPCSKENLRAHLTQVLEKLAGDIATNQASVEIKEPLPDVWANPVALEQVLTNLLTNALKFVAKGVRPHLMIRAEDTGAAYRILIQDNGIGIPKEHQQSIFGVFQRLHPPEKYPGTGIGLAIVQKSLERMGGKVGVNSTEGKGSCFWFELRKSDWRT